MDTLAEGDDAYAFELITPSGSLLWLWIMVVVMACAVEHSLK